MNNSIIILTELNENIGLGHFTRCHALYEEAILQGYKVKMYIEGNKSLVNEKNLIFKDWKNISFINSELDESDYVIIDSYTANYNLLLKISEKVAKAIYLDDYNRLNYPKGILINPSPNISLLNYSHNIVYGSKFVILRRSFRNISKHSKKSLPFNVLLLIGGTDVLNLTPEITNSIVEMDKDIHINVVTNRQDGDFGIVGHNVKLFYKLNSEEIKNMMLESNLAIISAGQTIYEAIICKAPFIAIKTAKNQEGNIRFLSEIGFADFIINNPTRNKIKQLILEVYNMIIRGSYFIEFPEIDGYGAKRVIKILSGDYKNNNFIFRNVSDKDKERVYHLSNDPIVRESSLNDKTISWEEHCKWFENKLKNKKNIFYIVLNEEDEILGQIRCDFETKYTGILSISLSSMIRGKGYAKTILLDGILKIFSTNDTLITLYAIVKKENKASNKIFNSLKFKCVKSDERINYYILERRDLDEI